MTSWLRRVLLYVIVAAGLNLGLAWLIAWRFNSQRMIVESGPYLQHDTASGWSWNGSLRRGLHTEVMSVSAERTQSRFENQMGSIQQFRNDLPAPMLRELLRWCGDIENPTPRTMSLTVVARGWPLPAFYLRREPTFGVRIPAVSGGWVIIPESSRTLDGVELPYTPYWTGLILNSFLFMPVVGMLELQMRIARQWNRYRRGRCPKCRYDLRFNFAVGCTECGWRRQTG